MTADTEPDASDPNASDPSGSEPNASGPSRADRREVDDRYLRYVVSPEVFAAYRPVKDARLAGRFGLGFGRRTRGPTKRRAPVARTDAQHVRVVLEPNHDFKGGREAARSRIFETLKTLTADDPDLRLKDLDTSQVYIFAALTLEQLCVLVGEDRKAERDQRTIYKVWPDYEIAAFIDRSVRTIKADACHRVFEATGEDILWAVIDSGVERHPHFDLFHNLEWQPDAGEAPDALRHRDFTGAQPAAPLVDIYGHGTHVAGILAGASPADVHDTLRVSRERDERDQVSASVGSLSKPLTGVAPKARILSLKVLDDKGKGEVSSLIAALEYVERVNEGRKGAPRIHGVNISLGYPFLSPDWFAAGRSPVCEQVNRLVDRKVVVVVAAGNDGSAFLNTGANARRIGLDQSIADPGNAESAITVGSTHPEDPEGYGVSYFSSKGPTADGRLKPDLVAPGERILSCASKASFDKALSEAGLAAGENTAGKACYRQDSGTSMAAPHVSGAIAAFMSVQRNLIGNPREAKRLVMENATDLGRARHFQGTGVLDLLRTMQAGRRA